MAASPLSLSDYVLTTRPPPVYYLQHGETGAFRVEAMTLFGDYECKAHEWFPLAVHVREKVAPTTMVQPLAFEYATRADATRWNNSLQWHPCPFVPLDTAIIEREATPCHDPLCWHYTLWMRHADGRIRGHVRHGPPSEQVATLLRRGLTVQVVVPDVQTYEFTTP